MFVSGLGVFLPAGVEKKSGRRGVRGLSSAMGGLEGLEREIGAALDEASAVRGEGNAEVGEIVLVVDQLDLFLAASDEGVTAQAVLDMTLRLRQVSHSRYFGLILCVYMGLAAAESPSPVSCPFTVPSY